MLKAADVAVGDASAASRRARMVAARQRLRAAEELTARLATDAARLAAIKITPDLAQQLRRASANIAAAEARLQAHAVVIDIDPIAGGAGKFLIDGRAYAGAPLTTLEPVVIDIAGVGKIRISPGGGDDRASLQAALEQQRRQMVSLLDAAGIADPNSVDAALAERQSIDATINTGRAELAHLAPDGLAALTAAMAKFDDLAAPSELEPSAGRLSEAELDAALNQAQLARDRAKATADACLQADGEIAVRMKGLTTEREIGLQRLSDLAAKLGPEAERADARAALKASMDAAKTAFDGAVREASVWRAEVVDDARLQHLTGAVAAAQRSIDNAEGERRRIEASILRHEAALDAMGANDAEGDVNGAAEALATAEARVATLSDEVEALRLLDRLLVEGLEKQSSQSVEPLLRRLTPFLQPVFPGSSLMLDDDFIPTGLQRNGVVENLVRLSDGAQEQIAVAVRLAMGRMLADAGAPAPLILDDALVYADDDRIAAMFGSLRAAAARHQVIVFTCRQKTFADLEAPRLTLTPWSGAS